LRNCLAAILMIAVMLLPLSGLGHDAADHGASVEFALADYVEEHGHSHDVDAEDFETLSDEADHHHADHTHEKASTPPTQGLLARVSASASFTFGHDYARPDRLYGIDRPPRPYSLA
jgi:hypothetical protein